MRRAIIAAVLLAAMIFGVLVLFAILAPAAEARMLCAHPRGSSLRIRDECRPYELPVTADELGIPALVGPPGPPGPAGDGPGSVRLSCVLRNTALKPDGTAGGGNTLPIETACLPDEDAIGCGGNTYGGYWMFLPCVSRPVGEYGMAQCCRILRVD